jgi:DNA-binding NtrC family response regulator/signal transduction histidine kinase
MATKRKFLVIDDEQGICNLLSCALNLKGYGVKTARDYDSGMELYHQDKFDMVLSDIHMPGKNGIEIVKNIKKENPEQIILLFSSHSDRNYELESRAKELGVFDCIFKPFDINKVMLSIDKALNPLAGKKSNLKESGINNADKPEEKEIAKSAKIARILVIDDEQGVRNLLSYELNMHGYEVVTAQNGLEGVEKIKKEKFDLVISDIKMPKLDGVETLKKIKKIDPCIEVIMATGFGTVETAVESMKAGAYDYISKPFNLEEVSLLIEKALEKHEIKTLLGIYEMSKAMFETVNLNEVLKRVTSILKKTVKSDEILLFLLNKDGELNLTASDSAGALNGRGTKMDLYKTAAAKFDQDNTPIIFNAAYPDTKCEGLHFGQNIKAAVIYPLFSKNKKLGVLCLNRMFTHEAFNGADMKTLDIFVSQISQSIENAQLYEALKIKIEQLEEAYKRLDRQKVQLVETEKLASIGRLVSGVAHELNNPLMITMGTLQLILNNSITGKEMEVKMRLLYAQAKRCREIIENLLLFSRQRPPLRGMVDILQLINEVLDFLKYEINKGEIIVEKKFMGKIPKISADPDQIRQVFLNIVNNAISFIGFRENKECEGCLIIEVKQEADNLKVIFKDNGVGISPGDRGKIFDPFFTTKEMRQGMGLGLSLCYGIMKEHKGAINVESAKGEGSTFTVIFPLIEKEGENKRVLIIDDEDGILDLLETFLNPLGYNVDKVTDGAEVIDAVEKRKYDIILCDLHMSGLSGRDILREIKKKDKKLSEKIIFLTGNTFDEQANKFLQKAGNRYLQKPFDLEKLASLIELLSSKTE